MSMLLRRYHEKTKEQNQKALPDNIDEMTVEELRALAKEKGIEDYHKMKKSELIDALKESD